MGPGRKGEGFGGVGCSAGNAVAPAITAVVGALVGYIVGNWKLKLEHLHERRAEVTAEVSKLLAGVQRGVIDFTNPLQPHDVDRHEQAEEAKRAFFELALQRGIAGTRHLRKGRIVYE